jgi:tetratricopeptide (TPR) repeat protein
MELADAAAADRTRLDAQLAAAEEAGTGQGLEAFFRDGASTLDPGDFLAALKAWTVTALDALSPEARLMAEFVACLEDGDRRSDTVEANWADVWRRLERPGDPPAPEPLLSTLALAALVEAEPASATGAGDQTGIGSPPGAGTSGQPGPVTFRVHPGVAAAITAQAGQAVREATDAGLAAFWAAVSRRAQEQEGGEDSDLVVRAGLAAAPYLLRRGDWDAVGFLLEQAVLRDRSPGTAQAVLPSLRRVAAATGTPKDASRLGRVLRGVDAGEAEQLLRGAADAAAEVGDYRVASGGAGELFILLRDAGRLAEALAVADQKAEFTGRAGLGPWTRLADQARRLLAECQRVFEDHADTPMLARVLTARASLEAALGRWPAAADLARAALRLAYARPEPRDIAIGHHNLSNHLGHLGDDRAGQRAHRLAAALIFRLSGMAHDLADTVRDLAAELRGGDPAAQLPATVAQVVATAELTEGVRLGALLAALQPDPRTVEDALVENLRAAAAPETPARATEER